MTIEILLVFAIILIAIVLFITEWLSIDTVAFGIMVTLMMCKFRDFMLVGGIPTLIVWILAALLIPLLYF